MWETTGEALWIVDSYFRQFEVKVLMNFVFSMLIDGLEWTIVMFLSAVWTHSDGTHSL